MKILFISSGNSKAGITPIVRSQGESLKSAGIDLDYFTIVGKGMKGYLKNIPRLRTFLAAKNYDLIHAHYGLCGLLCVLSFISRPLVLSLMGGDAYGSFDVKGRRITKSHFEMYLTQFAMVFSKYIIVKSKNLLRYVPYKKKTSIIPNGVNFDIFKLMDKEIYKEVLNLPPDKKHILFLANHLDPRKNYKLFYESSNYIKAQNIEFINPYPIKHCDVAKYLNAADVVVLTSYHEGSPNVIKEAMSCNCPIVSTDVGDVKEVIGNTEGCYITSYDPEDVAKKIKMALDFSKRTKGKDRIISMGLDSDSISKKIINLYQKVIR